MRCFAPAVALLLAGATASFADTITRAQVTVDAADPGAPRVTSTVTILVEDGKTRNLTLYLNRALPVTSARAGEAAVGISSEEVAGTGLRRWSFALPSAVPFGESVVLTLDATVTPRGVPGIHADEEGGFLLPGTGWFPQTSPETDERPVHSTTFRLPAGMIGIAAGKGGGSGSWTTATSARPYAAWGRYESREVSGRAAGASAPTSFTAFRRPGRDGDVLRTDLVAGLIRALETGFGADESASWKLIDVGRGIAQGGWQTVFWDEAAAAQTGGTAATLIERDLGAAVATSFWTERFRTVGEHAAWLSRGMAYYLGDVAYCALDESDDRTAREAAVIGSRRASFLEGIQGDRALAGVVAASADGSWLLETRGALLGHMLAEVLGSRSRWMIFLGEFRRDHAGASIDLATFREVALRSFPRQQQNVWPLFESTDLPDFRITSHGLGKGKHADRYRVETENRGAVAAQVEIATYTADGHPIRSFRTQLPAGGRKAVLFQDADRIGRIILDPRGTTLQPDVSGEDVRLKAATTAPAEPYVPSFVFGAERKSAQAVQDFRLDLDGVSITEFDGHVMYFGTHHGPSGAALMGTGKVTIRPTGAFAAGFRAAMKRDELGFAGAREMWVRFPLSAWPQIEPQLGSDAADDSHELFQRRKNIYEATFPSYFHEENRAQIPPPGSALVIFRAAGGEWRGVVRQPRPDGKVTMRLWDHLRGETLWEETH